MESLRKKTIDKILKSKDVNEIEASILLAIHKLEAHKVHKHLIERFIAKIEDQVLKELENASNNNMKFLMKKTLEILKRKEYKNNN